ncbi:hypothetical protein EI94DRAFT_454880 [Lactarius quietus]|nr:hypothetical protein EI94DRAFT_454880 [Lactarius quietus]
MIMSFTSIISLTSRRRSKRRSIGTLSRDKIPPPSAPLPPISAQPIMRDPNHQRLRKPRCREHSSLYETRGGLSSNQCAPHLSSRLTCPMDWEQLAPERLHAAREREQLRRIHLRNKGGLTLRAPGRERRCRSRDDRRGFVGCDVHPWRLDIYAVGRAF